MIRVSAYTINNNQVNLIPVPSYQLLKFSCDIAIEQDKCSSTASIHFYWALSESLQSLQGIEKGISELK